MATGTIQVIQNDKKDKWYLADGLTEADVIAAYQFVYAPSKEDALININEGTQYPLLCGSNVRWAQGSGMHFPDTVVSAVNLRNETISNNWSSVKACVFGFHFVSWDGKGNMVGIALHDQRWLGHSNNLTSGTQWGFLMNGGNGWKSIGWRCQTGTLGCNFSENYIYVNGTKYSASTTINPPYGRGHDIMTYQAGDLGNSSGNVVPALVLYNKDLTYAQHSEIAKNINNLGAVR